MKTVIRSKDANHLLCHCGALELTKLGPQQYVCEKCGSPSSGDLEGPEVEVIEIPIPGIQIP